MQGFSAGEPQERSIGANLERGCQWQGPLETPVHTRHNDLWTQ